MVEKLTDEERRVLWEQFADSYVHSQETFDASVRTLAAAGLGVTVALGTALKHLEDSGVAATCAFLVSLGANLVSYWSAQRDMRVRLDSVADADRKGAFGNGWTKLTHFFNAVGGVALIAGGALLAYFVATAT